MLKEGVRENTALNNVIHLISWCGKFAERHSFGETFSQNFHTRKLGEITMFYVVEADANTDSTNISLQSLLSKRQ